MQTLHFTRLSLKNRGWNGVEFYPSGGSLINFDVIRKDVKG